MRQTTITHCSKQLATGTSCFLAATLTPQSNNRLHTRRLTYYVAAPNHACLKYPSRNIDSCLTQSSLSHNHAQSNHTHTHTQTPQANTTHKHHTPHEVWGQMDYPSGLGRNPVQILQLDVYVLSHHTLPRASFYLKINTTGVLLLWSGIVWHAENRIWWNLVFHPFWHPFCWFSYGKWARMGYLANYRFCCDDILYKNETIYIKMTQIGSVGGEIWQLVVKRGVHAVTWIYVSHEAQKWHLSDYPF